jgi:hypothetical protein
VKPNVLAGKLLNFRIDSNSVALESSHPRIAIERVYLARCVPAGTRGELLAFAKHDISAPELGEVVQDTAAHDPAANNHYTCVRLHRFVDTMSLAERMMTAKG